MQHLRIRQQILEVCMNLVSDKLVYGSQGNVSILDEKTGHIIITPSAIPYSRITTADMCIIRSDGTVVEGNWKPTSEFALHLSLYRFRKDIQAVIHTHPPYATVFSVIYKPIPTILTEAATCLGGDIKVAPYFRPGTQGVADSAVRTMGTASAVLLGNHGLVCVGETIDRAYESTLAAESSARITIMALSMNEKVMTLDNAEASELRKLYLSNYRATKIEVQRASRGRPRKS